MNWNRVVVGNNGGKKAQAGNRCETNHGAESRERGKGRKETKKKERGLRNTRSSRVPTQTRVIARGFVSLFQVLELF